MAFGGFDQRINSRPMAEINMVPLIDVMLVLLVVFIITAPLLTHAVKIELPRASSAPNESQRDKIELTIDAAGGLHWNGTALAADSLPARFDGAAMLDPQPDLHIRADGSVRYEVVAQVMSNAASAGLARIGFVSDPTPRK